MTECLCSVYLFMAGFMFISALMLFIASVWALKDGEKPKR